jgi:hypothetical protein
LKSLCAEFKLNPYLAGDILLAKPRLLFGALTLLAITWEVFSPTSIDRSQALAEITPAYRQYETDGSIVVQASIL